MRLFDVKPEPGQDSPPQYSDYPRSPGAETQPLPHHV